MSDTTAAAEAPAQNPAEVTKNEETVAKTDATAETSENNATESVKNGDNAAVDGAAEVVKTEESSADKSEKKDGRENGRKFDNRRGGNKFGGNRRKYVRLRLLFKTVYLPSSRRNDEFENLPDSDDPNEIRQQVRLNRAAYI